MYVIIVQSSPISGYKYNRYRSCCYNVLEIIAVYHFLIVISDIMHYKIYLLYFINYLDTSRKNKKGFYKAAVKFIIDVISPKLVEVLYNFIAIS